MCSLLLQRIIVVVVTMLLPRVHARIVINEPCTYYQDCGSGSGFNCVNRECLAPEATTCAGQRLVRPAAASGLYWLGATPASAVLTYCDMASSGGIPLCVCSSTPTTTIVTSGVARDGSNLAVQFNSSCTTINGGGVVCKVWNLRSGVYPIDSTTIDGCANVGFAQAYSYSQCLFSVMQGDCGFRDANYYRFGVTCNGCSTNNGPFPYLVLQGVMSNMAAVLTSVDGSSFMQCWMVDLCNSVDHCNGRALNVSGRPPNCVCECQHGFGGPRCFTTMSVTTSLSLSTRLSESVGTLSSSRQGGSLTATATRTSVASSTVTLVLTGTASASVTPLVSRSMPSVSNSITLGTPSLSAGTMSKVWTVSNNTFSPTRTSSPPTATQSSTANASHTCPSVSQTATESQSLSVSDCSVWPRLLFVPPNVTEDDELRLQFRSSRNGLAEVFVSVEDWAVFPPLSLTLWLFGGDPWHTSYVRITCAGAAGNSSVSVFFVERRLLGENHSLALAVKPEDDNVGWPLGLSAYRNMDATVDVSLRCAVVTRQASMTVVIAAKPIPLREVVITVAKISMAMSTLSGATSLSVSTLQMLISLSSCGTSAQHGDGLLVLPINEDAEGSLGTIAGNFVLLAVVAVSVMLFSSCVLCRKRKPTTWETLLIRLHVPSVVYPVLMFTLPTSVSSSIFAWFNAAVEQQSAAALAIAALVFYVFAVVLLVWSIATHHAALESYEVPLNASVFSGSTRLRMFVFAQQVTCRTHKWRPHRNADLGYTEGLRALEKIKPIDPAWVWYLRLKIVLCESRLWWFCCVEPTFMVLACVVSGVSVGFGTRVSCISGVGVVLAMNLFLFGIAVHYRPKTTIVDVMLHGAVAFITVLSLIATLGFELTYGSNWILAAMVFQLLIGVLSMLDGVRMCLTALRVLYRLVDTLVGHHPRGADVQASPSPAALAADEEDIKRLVQLEEEELVAVPSEPCAPEEELNIPVLSEETVTLLVAAENDLEEKCREAHEGEGEMLQLGIGDVEVLKLLHETDRSGFQYHESSDVNDLCLAYEDKMNV